MTSNQAPEQAKSKKNALAYTTAMVGVAALAAVFTPSVAFAQDDDEEAIVVTGTRIARPNLYTTSPVTQVTSQDITTQGVTRIEDLTNQLPQVFAAQGASYSNGATGTAQVNLRGLGAVRTLVLVDGRRLPYGSPNSSAADVNQIPAQLVERVEVLTGGASAVYGSDAVAGVVNFIMRDDFEGFRIDGQYGWYQHNNDYDGPGDIRAVIEGRAATNPSQFVLPEDNVDDGYGKEITAIFGVSSPDGRGNITAYAAFRNDDQVLQRDRDYSACALGNPTAAAPGRFTCGGSSTSFPGRFTDFATFDYTIDQSTGNFIPWVGSRDLYNYGPTNYYQRPSERYSLGAFAHYEINPNVEAYSQLMYTDYRSVSQIAPSGDFFVTGTINCGNPLLTAANAAAIGCDATEISTDAITSMYIGRRNVEGGGRRDDIAYESFRTVGGFRGAITDNWEYDLSMQMSQVHLARTYRNDFSITRVTRAIDVVDDGSGNPVCRSVVDGSDPNCVVWDIFTPNSVTAEALNYVQIPLIQTGTTTQQVVTGSVTGDFGFGSPAAESNIAGAFGVEYRRDRLETDTDLAFQTGDGAGQGGPTLPLEGTTDVMDVFGEVSIPLVEGAPLAHLMSMDAAYRYSEYLSGISSDSYKIGLDWAPTEDVRFRGSFQRAVRAANVLELFLGQGFGLFDMDDDPCDTTDPAADGVAPTSACQGTNAWQVSAAQAGGGGLESPAGQYNLLGGGNPNLEPEEADTYTAGFVFTPTFLQGLIVSVDYFNIEVAGLVSTTGAVNTINDCYFNSVASSCARILRNPGTGQLWVGAGRVEDLNTNIGGLSTSGVDINADYSFDLGEYGVSLELIGTWLDELVTDPGAVTGVAPYDCVGSYGQSLCGTPNPEWRHRFRVGLEMPFDVNLYATWRHYGEVQLVNGANVPQTGRPDSVFEAENYLDISGNWNVKDNARLRFGVNNILDNDPPVSAQTGAGAGNGNTYPQVYDALGRWVFAGVTLDF